MKLGQSLEKIAENLVEDVSVIKPIYNMAEKYEPEKILEELLCREDIACLREMPHQN